MMLSELISAGDARTKWILKINETIPWSGLGINKEGRPCSSHVFHSCGKEHRPRKTRYFAKSKFPVHKIPDRRRLPKSNFHGDRVVVKKGRHPATLDQKLAAFRTFRQSRSHSSFDDRKTNTVSNGIGDLCPNNNCRFPRQ